MNFSQYPAVVHKTPVTAVITVLMFAHSEKLSVRDDSVEVEQPSRVSGLVPYFCTTEEVTVTVKIPAQVSKPLSAHTGYLFYKTHTVFVVFASLEYESVILSLYRYPVFLIHIAVREINAVISLEDDLIAFLNGQYGKKKKYRDKDGEGYFIAFRKTSSII
jgi:hypothetical protein